MFKVYVQYIGAFIGFMLFTPCSMLAQQENLFRALARENQSCQFRTTLLSSDTISLDGLDSIYSLSIDARIHQPREASFTRIVLEDKDGYDYLVAESDWFRNDTTAVTLEHFCEETALLEGVTPIRLKCYLAGEATLTLSGIHTSNQPAMRKSGKNAETERGVKEAQVKDIVDRINKYNKKHGRIWRAEVTDYALAGYNQREQVNDVDRERRNVPDPYIANLKYYAGGIYEMGERQDRSVQSNQTSEYIPSFSWANRYGINWMTPTKDQGNSQWCELFAACSTLEGLVNLYFNQHLDLDLSEKDLAYNLNLEYEHQAGGGAGMYTARDYGVVDDDGLPLNHVYSSRPTGNELIQFSSLATYNPRTNGTEGVKGILLQYGPCVSGTLSHAMALVGWGKATMDDVYTISDYNNYDCQVDSSLIGLDYWIFKDSHYQAPNPFPHPKYGTHPGYLHVIFNSPYYFYTLYYVNSNISSLNYSTDDVICEDLDGDGYFYWGIGPRPSSIPSWAELDEDGNDYDDTKGKMFSTGYLDEIGIGTNTLYITSTQSFSSDSYERNPIVVCTNGKLILTATMHCYRGVTLSLESGSILEIDGGCLDNIILNAQAGSSIIIKNGGQLIGNKNHGDITIPIGVNLDISEGEIKIKDY